MQQMHPETKENPEAAEGTASHEVGAKLIFAASVAAGFIDLPVGQPASNGVMIDDEMYEGAELFADNVAEIMRSTAIFGGSHFNIEQRVNCPTIHELSFGTPDMWIYDQKAGIIYIWDYKYGYEIHEVFENWQLLNYIAGIITLLKLNGVDTQYTKVHFRIVQPRAHHRDGPIREWITFASDLRGYFNNLESKACESLGANSVTRSGPHCHHCSARHACSVALQSGLKLYEISGQPMSVELSPNALGTQLTIVRRAIKQLEYIESGMTEQVKGLVRSGASIPGWKLEMGLGREWWDKPIPEIIALGDAMGIDVRKPDNVCTPKQARKKGIDDTLVSQYSGTPQTGLRLVPDNGSKAKRMFNNGN